MANGSAAHLEGDTDPNNETLVSSTTSRSRETTPSGIKGTRLTTESKFRTPGGEVKRTAEGDAAYTALSQEQREAQDTKFKAKQRSESQTRFTPDAIKMPKAGVESVKPKITTPDVNKEIYSKVFSPSENPNYGLRKKLYETARLKRYNDSRSGKITFEEAKAQSKPLKEMKKAMKKQKKRLLGIIIKKKKSETTLKKKNQKLKKKRMHILKNIRKNEKH